MHEDTESPREVNLVKLYLAEGETVEGEITCYAKYARGVDPGACCLELKIGSFGNFYHEGPDYFTALIKLRRELESMDVKLLCFGARRDVWASALQGGAGMQAYLLSAATGGSKPAQCIFDYAPLETIGTIEEQYKYSHPKSLLAPDDREIDFLL